jgi:hypothetical protein
MESQICEKGTRDSLLSEEQIQANRNKSKVRSRIVHIFDTQAAIDTHHRPTERKGEDWPDIVVYNMMRLVQFIKRNVKAVNRGLIDKGSEGAPVGA